MMRVFVSNDKPFIVIPKTRVFTGGATDLVRIASQRAVS